MKTLGLTRPLTTGDDVLRAQRRLIAAEFLRAGGGDGVFGPETARACKRAHYWLGFGGRLTNAPTYGDVLDHVLDLFLSEVGHHGDALPLAYRIRRRRRLKAAEAKTIGENALVWLRPHIGDTENPAGSNRVEWASVWYGYPTGAWCAMGVTRALVEGGSKEFRRGQFAAYVPYIIQAALAGERGLVRSFEPTAGSLVCFDFGPARSALNPLAFDHVELVEQPPASLAAGTRFTTIGCNTSFGPGGSQSNGGACARRPDRVVIGGNRTVFVNVHR